MMEILSAEDARRLSDEANRRLGPEREREDEEQAEEVLRLLDQAIRNAIAAGRREAHVSLGSSCCLDRPVFLLVAKEMAKRGYGAYAQELTSFEICVFWD